LAVKDRFGWTTDRHLQKFVNNIFRW